MSTELAKRDGVRTFEELIDAHKGELAAQLPERLGITPDRFCATALAALSDSPALLRCTPESVIQSLYKAAQLGLVPGLLNSAHLIPYKNQCRLIPGYGGLRDLALRSGAVRNIESHLVYEKDEFAFALGTEPRIEHVPHLAQDRGEVIAAYAVAHLAAGGIQVEIMPRDEIDRIRRRSRASGNGPWVTDFGEMARKTVLRRLCKHLPQTPDLAQAIQLENDAEGEAEREEKAVELLTPGRHKPSASNPDAEALKDDLEAAFHPPVCPKCGGPMVDQRDKRTADLEAIEAGTRKRKARPAWKCEKCGEPIWSRSGHDEPKDAEPEPDATAGELTQTQTQIKDMVRKLRLPWQDALQDAQDQLGHALHPEANIQDARDMLKYLCDRFDRENGHE